MHKVLIFHILLILAMPLQAQLTGLNLIPNGSFEKVDTCKSLTVLADNVTDWFIPNLGSTDLYFNCALANNGLTGVPSNGIVDGYQYAYDGDNYVGIVFFQYEGNTYNAREYLACKLKTPLMEDSLYQITLQVNLPNGVYGYCKNCIEIMFTADTGKTYGYYELDHIGKVVSMQHDYINDTVNWITLDKLYMATGNEKYFYIGYFDDSLSVLGHEDDSPYSFTYYYYIDSVSMYKVATTEQFITLPNIFTPNGDGINDRFHPLNVASLQESKFYITVFNRWGNVVFKQQGFSWNGKTNGGKKLNAGVYYYVISGKINTQGFVHLVR